MGAITAEPKRLRVPVAFIFVCCLVWMLLRNYAPTAISVPGDELCPLVEKIDPTERIYNSDTLQRILHDDNFKNESLSRLLLAVRYPTQIFDDMVNPNSADTLEQLYEIEPRWREFEKFIKYLAKAYPLTHKHLSVERVNKFGLVFTWKGTTDKKPLLLTAHYDVVPVQNATVNQWTFPPFEGGYDGEFAYGRGVSDCKDLLVGLFETVELLLGEGQFTPLRTIVLAFGYDEEASGTGAVAISEVLEQRYGQDSFYQLIDEGSQGFETIEGVNLILAATGEKGHLDSILEVFTPGGHSSVPPKHTGIGLLLRLVAEIEDEEFASVISNANPVLNLFQCMARHSPTMKESLRLDVLKAHLDAGANQRLLSHIVGLGPLEKYLVTTSQAVDVISGGVKSNALPEHAQALVNQRIAVEETVESTANKILAQVEDFAARFDLGVEYEGRIIKNATDKGYIRYTLKDPLEPAPITPIGDEVWHTFGGALRYLYEDLRDSNETFVFAPFMGTGNTDTKAYWNLTQNIFRYSPGLPTPGANIHSVDERVNFEGHLLVVAFYYYYLQLV